MKRILSLIVALLALTMVSCQTAAPPPPPVPPEQQQILDLDPRLGTSQSVAEQVTRRFEAALRELRAGRTMQAEERFETLRSRNPEYRAIAVAMANLAIRSGDLDAAQAALESVLRDEPDYIAANALAAEVALRENDLERAYSLLKQLSAAPDAVPAIRNAFQTTRRQYFDSLFERANATADAEESITLLRQALSIVPEAEAARVLLVQKLIGALRFDDARRQVEPLVQSRPGSAEVEWALAEIDAGKGRYQEAIARYEKLARIDPERYEARLNEVKQKWLEANMPPQYHAAVASDALTRAELAVLMYWKVSAVRFATVSPPPIAIDVAGVQGRDEFVRALALRLYSVDPVTRLAVPERLVTAAGFVRLAERLLLLRGTPACARGGSGDDDLSRAAKTLSGCGVSVSTLVATPEATISGREAAQVLDAIDSISGSAE